MLPELTPCRELTPRRACRDPVPEVLLEAIGRVAEMRRKPKSFDSTAFFVEVAQLLAQCPVDEMEP